jgi:hypothetical protein
MVPPRGRSWRGTAATGASRRARAGCSPGGSSSVAQSSPGKRPRSTRTRSGPPLGADRRCAFRETLSLLHNTVRTVRDTGAVAISARRSPSTWMRACPIGRLIDRELLGQLTTVPAIRL